MKKYIPLFFSLLIGQSVYQGPMNFTYSGSENGIFSSTLDDTTNMGGALNVVMSDSSSFMMMGISPQGENDFDLFVTMLQDTTFPVQPRTWDWNLSFTDLLGLIDNPLSLSTLAIFIPGLDSTFANQWLSFFTDTTNVNDSLAFDSLATSFFENLIDDMYIGVSGQISIEQVSDQNISGMFTCTMLKPVLSWPLSEIVIENGEFYYEPVDLENLSIDKDVIITDNINLGLAYPNPFNPVTHIPYNVNLGQNINISIFDLNGKKIKSLINKFHQPGKYKLSFNAKELSSGIYFISFQNNNHFQSQKIVLTK